MGTAAQLDAELLSRRIKAVRSVLLKIASVLVGLLEVMLGGILTLFALPALAEWPALTLALRGTILLWLVAGPVTFGCGLWSIVTLGRFRLPQWIGAAAGICAGAVLIIGVLAHFIPCASPT